MISPLNFAVKETATERRYIAVVQVYVFATSDEEANRKAWKFANKGPDHTRVVEIVDQPFGSIREGRKVRCDRP